MNEQLFELLENADLVRKGEVNLNRIQKLSVSEIVDLSHQAALTTSIENIERERSLFVHSASLSLSGEAWPCAHIKCRLKRATELAQFASLYSERIYFRNFLADYSTHTSKVSEPDIFTLHEFIAGDISVLLFLRPLIKKGLLVPITPPNYCLHCLTSGPSFGKDADKRFGRIFRELTRRYNEELEVYYLYEDDMHLLKIQGPETLLNHGRLFRFSLDPYPVLNEMPRTMKQVMSGKEVKLSRTTIKKMEIDSRFANQVEESIIFELATSLSLGTTFLTDRELDVQLLKQLSSDPQVQERDQLLQKYMTCIVPFIDSVNPTELLKLRHKEEEAFILFRKALTNAVEEHKKQGIDLTARDAKAIYGDIIQPELARLDSKVKAARRRLIKSTSSQIVSWTGAISLGVYTGLLPSGIIAAAAALGLVKIGAELTQEFLTKKDTEEEIRQEEMYFLWKVRQKARSKKRMRSVR